MDYLAIKKKYIDFILWHNRTVVNLMVLLEINRARLPFEMPEWELINRALQHDVDKFQNNYGNATIEKHYPSSTSPQTIEEIWAKYNAHDHYKTKTHHIEYHKITGAEITDLDICEMCCDWVASSYKNPNDTEKMKKYTNFKEKVFAPEYKETLEIIAPYREKFDAVMDLINSFNLINTDFFEKVPDFLV